MDPSSTRYVVGLGNPGRRYERTRHNVGFWVLEALAQRWNAQPPSRAFNGFLWDAKFRGTRVMLLEPQTFMNASGQSVGELVRFYKATPSDLMIVLDDMALPVGRIRLRNNGSAGGHNGLTDILRVLGTQEVPRLRVGIGSPPPVMEWVDYVLGVMDEGDRALANQAIDQACLAIEDWISLGLDAAMNRHNRQPGDPKNGSTEGKPKAGRPKKDQPGEGETTSSGPQDA